MAISPHGTQLGKGKGTITDTVGNAFTYASVPTRKGAQVNKGGVSTAFPGTMAVELWYVNGSLVGKKFGGSWVKYNGSSWVSCNPANDM